MKTNISESYGIQYSMNGKDNWNSILNVFWRYGGHTTKDKEEALKILKRERERTDCDSVFYYHPHLRKSENFRIVVVRKTFSNIPIDKIENHKLINIKEIR